MRASTWTKLLANLAKATESGDLQWRYSDRPGNFVASFLKGSVVLTGGPGATALLRVLQPSPTVEIRDEEGEVVAELVGEGGFNMVVTTVPSDDAVRSAMSTQQRELIEQIFSHLESIQKKGEQLGLDIIAELGGDAND
jgi:hypothetical protein